MRIYFCRLHSFFYGVYTDLAFIAALAFEFYATFDSSENGVILAHANIVAGMEFGATLTNDDAASGYQLAVMSFGAQTLRVGVTTVVGATGTFFMCM